MGHEVLSMDQHMADLLMSCQHNTDPWQLLPSLVWWGYMHDFGSPGHEMGKCLQREQQLPAQPWAEQQGAGLLTGNALGTEKHHNSTSPKLVPMKGVVLLGLRVACRGWALFADAH